MTHFKRWLRNFFGFSRGQSNAFIILLPLLALLALSEPLMEWYARRQPHDFSFEKAKLDSLVHSWPVNGSDSSIAIAKSNSSPKLFAFNPNTATLSELKLLGLDARISTHIVHYRDKGGKFKIKSDLLKIYGMEPPVYKSLYEYIDLPEKINEVKPNYATTASPYEKREVKVLRFDINMCDTIQLKSIYGIGSKLASRIIKFRDGLGGFVSVEQFHDIFGLDSTVINKMHEVAFIEQNFQPHKININTATESDLDFHPYINRTVAKAIVAYRFQHGKLTSIEDIRKLHNLKDDMVDKIIPYLSIE